jgi:small subunit ribosomal protein S15
MLKAEEKRKAIEPVKTHEKDTGSPEVQAALLSREIKTLASHLKKHPKDFGSRRGLLKMVAKRRRLLRYLEQENPRRYNALVKHLELLKE